MPPHTTVHITASPRGKRCGLFHYAGGDLSVTILVLPKPWRGQSHRRAVHKTDVTLTIVLYELDAIAVNVGCRLAAFLAGDVQNAIAASVRRKAAAKRKPQSGTVAEKRGLEFQDSCEDDDDSILNELVQFSSSNENESDGLENDSVADSIGDNLVALMRLAARCDPDHDPWVHESDQSAGMGGATGEIGAATQEPLALLTQWLFVELMERQLLKIRRGYLSVVETSSTVRGRITNRGVVQHAATKAPLIECEHDEFSEATSLYRVLVTTLEAIAVKSLASRLGLADWSIVKGLATKAMHLRRLLMPIAALPRGVAAHFAGQLRLTRLQVDWRRPLKLAKQILRTEPPRIAAAGAGSHGLQWWVDTSKLWERVVEAGLNGAGWGIERQGGDDDNQNKLDVWVGGLGRAKRPDAVAWHPSSKPDRFAIIDAKYKLGGAVSAADQYQIFCYSLLGKPPSTSSNIDFADISGQPCDLVALVYPFDNAATRQSGSYARAPIVGATSGDQRAVLCRIPMSFPGPEQLDLEGWQQYVEQAAQKLDKALSAPES